jgi:uncharacterized protein
VAKIRRKILEDLIKSSLANSKVTGLIGPRQVGKTTLARGLAKLRKERHFFDLEDPTDFDLLANAKLTLGNLSGLIIIDEIQRKPELFPYLRVKADQLTKKDSILLLGSSSRDLIEKTSESLAGRIRYIEISGLSLSEVKDSNRLFLRGGLPPSFTARNDRESFQWRKDYLRSYIERDLRGLGIELPPQSLRRLLEMLTGYHGQIFNSSELGKSMGFSHTTARKYLDILIGTFLVRELKPWSESVIQRQVKQPKIYIRDSGLLFSILGLQSEKDILRHPRLGSFWEGFALEETIKIIRAPFDELYFWALHQNGELDLLWKSGEKKIGFEFKYADSPQITTAMRNAINLLNLDHLYVVYPGTKRAPLDKRVTLIPLDKVSELKGIPADVD